MPLARHSSEPWTDSVTDLLRGATMHFTRDQALELYGDRAGYLMKFEAAAEDAVKRGVILQHDVAALLEEAATMWPS